MAKLNNNAAMEAVGRIGCGAVIVAIALLIILSL